jgi:arylsulfatase A-like enzyme
MTNALRWPLAAAAAAAELIHARPAVLILLMICAGACSRHVPLDSSRERAPNIVLIMMDDLGYGDLGSYGASDVRTPNIDRLAREGVRLTDTYANGPVCTPTRAALISGGYQQRVGLESVLTTLPVDRERGLPVSGASLPALLKLNGYTTGLIGKWHLGWKPEYGPNAHGFDDFYGFLSGAHSYYTNRQVILGVGEGSPDLFENTTPVEATGYLTDEITRRAVRFITRHADDRFFLEVAYNAVHWPFEPPDRLATDSARRIRQMPDDSFPATRQDYVRMLERADLGVGQILDVLDEHNLTGNTLVVFTSDNGGEWLSRNAPLFHRKGTLWEGGIRVPLILRWPGELPRGNVSGQVAITMDITASILAATGTRVPAGHRPDGIDILPILRANAPLVERHLYWRWATPNRQQRAVRSGQWKLFVDASQLLLFDLSVDPGERTDLAARYPDRVVALERMLDAWEADLNQPQRNP